MAGYPLSRGLLIALFVSLTLVSCQQTRQSDHGIIIGETITVPSRHSNRDMIIDVCLPDGYSEKTDRYPVVRFRNGSDSPGGPP